MNDPGGPSAGDIGGMFAGLVAVAIALGNGLRWWLGWTDRRAATRAAKLDAWQKELALREQRLDGEQARINAEIKQQLEELKSSNDELRKSNEQLRREHAALFGGFQLVASALRAHDPDNPALGRAVELLKAAFPLEVLLPGDLALAAAKLDSID